MANAITVPPHQIVGRPPGPPPLVAQASSLCIAPARCRRRQRIFLPELEPVLTLRLVIGQDHREAHRLTSTTTRVPRPGWDSMRQRPPAAAARSLMVMRPQRWRPSGWPSCS